MQETKKLRLYWKFLRKKNPYRRLVLNLLCFAYHRFRQINDNLIEAFIHWVDQYEKQAKLVAEFEVQQVLADAADNLKAAGQVLQLFVDSSIPSDASFAMVKEKAFTLLEAKRFSQVSDYMRNRLPRYEWPGIQVYFVIIFHQAVL